MPARISRRVALSRLLVLPAMPCLAAADARAREPAAVDDVVLLVASERMRDPRFRNTVLLLMRHGPGGPLGVVLNRPSEHSRGKVLPAFKALPDKQEPVFLGGPVAQRTLFYIARFDTAPAEVLTLAPGIFMGLNLQRLAELLDAGVKPSALRIFAGYAGWGPGQLEHELARQDWHLLPLDASAIFAGEPATLYPRMLARTRLLPA